jgi:hypothetical protein
MSSNQAEPLIAHLWGKLRFPERGPLCVTKNERSKARFAGVKKSDRGLKEGAFRTRSTSRKDGRGWTGEIPG